MTLRGAPSGRRSCRVRNRRRRQRRDCGEPAAARDRERVHGRGVGAAGAARTLPCRTRRSTCCGRSLGAARDARSCRLPDREAARVPDGGDCGDRRSAGDVRRAGAVPLLSSWIYREAGDLRSREMEAMRRWRRLRRRWPVRLRTSRRTCGGIWPGRIACRGHQPELAPLVCTSMSRATRRCRSVRRAAAIWNDVRQGRRAAVSTCWVGRTHPARGRRRSHPRGL